MAIGRRRKKRLGMGIEEPGVPSWKLDLLSIYTQLWACSFLLFQNIICEIQIKNKQESEKRKITSHFILTIKYKPKSVL